MPKPKRPIVRPKPKPKRSADGSGTPIGARRRALSEAQDKITAKREQLESFVQKAPDLKKQQEELRHNALMKERTNGSRRLDVSTLLDPRYESGIPSASPRARKSLKSERRQDRITFCGLLIFLLVLAFWVWTIVR